MKNRKVICTPELSEGKAYSLKDVTCKVLMVNLWSSMADRLGKTFDGVVEFSGNEDEGERFMKFKADSYMTYKRVSTFLGCWEWWSITLLILGIIIVIVGIVFCTIYFTSKKSKTVPKKK